MFYFQTYFRNTFIYFKQKFNSFFLINKFAKICFAKIFENLTNRFLKKKGNFWRYERYVDVFLYREILADLPLVARFMSMKIVSNSAYFVVWRQFCIFRWFEYPQETNRLRKLRRIDASAYVTWD